MSLDVSLKTAMTSEVFSGNITHNLAGMAEKADLYECLWRPDETGLTVARQLIGPLQDGLAKLQADPDGFRTLNSPNGWGCYENLVDFVERYLDECKRNPDASVSVWR